MNWNKDGVKFSLFLTFTQFLTYTIISYVSYRNEEKNSFGVKKAPLKSYIHYYVFVAICSFVSLGASNGALEYVNYPTQLLFKSCKLVPVMIVGIIIQHKRYPWTQYMSVLLMTIGMILLSVGGKTIDANFNFFGIILLSAALFADAFMGNIQELMYRKFNMSASELMFFNKGFSAIITGVVCLLNGQLWSGLAYTIAHPIVIFWIIISFF